MHYYKSQCEMFDCLKMSALQQKLCFMSRHISAVHSFKYDKSILNTQHKCILSHALFLKLVNLHSCSAVVVVFLAALGAALICYTVAERLTNFPRLRLPPSSLPSHLRSISKCGEHALFRICCNTATCDCIRNGAGMG